MPAGNKNTSWSIASDENITNIARIKIVDTSNPNTTYKISGPFAVMGTFDIIHPENDTLIAEETYHINWTSNGTNIGDVLLEYTTGGSWQNVTNQTLPNTGDYFWPNIPGDPLSDTCKVRISAVNNTNATNMSATNFFIRGKIQVSRPDGGESFNATDLEDINWTKKGNISSVAIYYSDNNGLNWTPVNTTVPASWLGYEWNITTDFNTTTEGLIRIGQSDKFNLVNDTSNATFVIKGKLNLTAPTNASEVLTYDGGTNTYNITWTKIGTIPKVKLKYSTNSGATYPYTIVENRTTSPYPWASA